MPWIEVVEIIDEFLETGIDKLETTSSLRDNNFINIITKFIFTIPSL